MHRMVHHPSGKPPRQDIGLNLASNYFRHIELPHIDLLCLIRHIGYL